MQKMGLENRAPGLNASEPGWFFVRRATCDDLADLKGYEGYLDWEGVLRVQDL